jgi:hypothetical protein
MRFSKLAFVVPAVALVVSAVFASATGNDV